MSEIEEIRQRDREAIPRFGPDKDPLLRAEMDRRWLLNNMYTREQVGEYQAREARLVSEPLRRWKEEALPVLEGLQELGRALDIPLGQRITGPAALAAVERLKAQVEELQRQLAETTGQVEVAQQAAREIMAERNTWARQLADMRDERDTAREQTTQALHQAGAARGDRDNLHVEMGELAERLVTEWPGETRRHSGDYRDGVEKAVNELRRALARWEAT